MYRIIIIFAGLLALVLGGLYFYNARAHDQPRTYTPAPKKTAKVALLYQKSNKTYVTAIAQLKKKLSDLNYTPEYLDNLVDDPKVFPDQAKNFVSQNADVIITFSTPATQAALNATNTIPVIFGSVGDPVANKLVQSLDSSGNNATGVSSLAVDLTPKRLDLLIELKPSLKTVYYITQPGEVSSENAKVKTLEEAKKLNIQLIEKDATAAAEVKAISDSLKGSEGGAILMGASALVWSRVSNLIEAQNREKIPLIGVDRTMSEQGAVISYGPNYVAMGEQIALLVDQIIKGVKPQYIPVQRPSKIEMVINQTASDNLGLTILPTTLNKVDQVIH